MPRRFSRHWWDSRGWDKPCPGEWETPGFEQLNRRPGQTVGLLKLDANTTKLPVNNN